MDRGQLGTLATPTPLALVTATTGATLALEAALVLVSFFFLLCRRAEDICMGVSSCRSRIIRQIYDHALRSGMASA